jgi:hypothetical protein
VFSGRQHRFLFLHQPKAFFFACAHSQHAVCVHAKTVANPPPLPRSPLPPPQGVCDVLEHGLVGFSDQSYALCDFRIGQTPRRTARVGLVNSCEFMPVIGNLWCQWTQEGSCAAMRQPIYYGCGAHRFFCRERNKKTQSLRFFQNTKRFTSILRTAESVDLV